MGQCKQSNKLLILAKVENNKELFFTYIEPYWVDNIEHADKNNPNDGEDMCYLNRKLNDLKIQNVDAYIVEFESEIVYKRTGKIIK